MSEPEVQPGRSPMVQLEAVTKSFGDNVVLDNLDLQVAPGEKIVIVGPSGSGKTTILRVIMTLDQPDSGLVWVGGECLYHERRGEEFVKASQAHIRKVRGQVGMVFQHFNLFPHLNAVENVAIGPTRVLGLSKAEARRRAAELLERVGLGRYAQQSPDQLSGGQKQRVAIARALALQPALLLMDEPFGALDEMTRERMQMELMRIWQQTRTTVVFVTHSIPEAVFLSTRVVVMSPRPGTVVGVVDIDLPQPRQFDTREHPQFFVKLNEVRETLRGAGVD